MTGEHTNIISLAEKIAARYSLHDQVEAITMAGSQTNGIADSSSDIDLDVYLRTELPLDIRTQIATIEAKRTEVNNRFWEPGDEWIDAGSGVHIDVLFRNKQWIEDQLERVLQRHEASVGYTTCFWHNVLSSRVLYDQDGWFGALQQRAQQPYPEQLRRAIVTKNHPILRRNLSAYRHQIELAVARDDLISVNHRVAAFLSSYFDILFAINRLPHPGEKRLVKIVEERCSHIPVSFRQHIDALLHAAALSNHQVASQVELLVDGLDALLHAENLLD